MRCRAPAFSNTFFKIQVIVIGQPDAAQDDLIYFARRYHHSHHLIERLVGVGKEGNLLPVTRVLLRSMPAIPVVISSDGCFLLTGLTDYRRSRALPRRPPAPSMMTARRR